MYEQEKSGSPTVGMWPAACGGEAMGPRRAQLRRLLQCASCRQAAEGVQAHIMRPCMGSSLEEDGGKADDHGDQEEGNRLVRKARRQRHSLQQAGQVCGCTRFRAGRRDASGRPLLLYAWASVRR